MGIRSAHDLSIRDIYVDYSFEGVMFRWRYDIRKAYRKFYGDIVEVEVPHNNRLFTDALLYGEEILEEEYLMGKPDEPRLHSLV